MAKASIYDVASLAGVSIATVSRTLNQPHRVSEDTRTRVMDSVTKLNYTPDLEAASRARHHDDRIAVIAPVSGHPAFTARLKGISEALEQSQVELIIFKTDTEKLRDPKNTKILDSLASSGKYDGIIVMELPVDGQDLNRIADTKFPCVLMESDDSRFTNVTIDNHLGAEMAVQELINDGYKKIAFIGYNPRIDNWSTASKGREQGYIDTLLKNGISVNPEYIEVTESFIEDGRRAAAKMFKLKNPPDAIFCACDVLALGALRAASDLGLTVPKDVAIMGFDDIEMAEYLELSTIRQALEDSGREAVNLVLKMMKDPLANRPKEVLLPLDLIVRKTN